MERIFALEKIIIIRLNCYYCKLYSSWKSVK